jgi:hypothetical protein
MPAYTQDYQKIKELQDQAKVAADKQAILTGAGGTFADDIKTKVRQNIADKGLNALSEAIGGTTGQIVSQPANIRARTMDVNPMAIDAITAKQLAQSLSSLVTLGGIQKDTTATADDIINAGSNQLLAAANAKKIEADKANTDANNILAMLKFKEEQSQNQFDQWYKRASLAQSGNDGLDFTKLMQLVKLKEPTAGQEDKAANADSALASLDTVKALMKNKDVAKSIGLPGFVNSLGALMGNKNSRGVMDLQKQLNNVKDILTRTRTGAALNMDEQKFYNRFISDPLDAIRNGAESTDASFKILEGIFSKVQKLGTNPYQNILDSYLQLQGIGGLVEDPTFTPD